MTRKTFAEQTNIIFFWLKNSFLIENLLEMQKTNSYCQLGCNWPASNASKLI